MRPVGLIFAFVALGCGTSPTVSASPPPSVSAPSVSPGSPSPSVSAAGSGIATTLPTELGGVALLPPQAFQAEFLAPLSQQLGVDPSSIEAASVTTSGSAAGPEVAVVRVPGLATDKLVDAFMAFNAKVFEIPASAKPARERIGGKDVLAMRAAGPDPGSTFILVVYGRGDTAYMVAYNMPQVVEEAVSKLP